MNILPDPFRTHYDNLMVARAAPPEVIAAAYRTLSKRLHPDVNQGDPRAEQVMRIVNSSYAVLSDPSKRRAHDEWIRAKENEVGVEEASAAPATIVQNSSSLPDSIGRHLANFWFIYFLVGILGMWAFAEQTPPKPSGLPNYIVNPSTSESEAQQSVAADEPAYIKPSTAPNGSPWPTRSAYISGYPISRADGLSKLTIDNRSNSVEMFVKLVALDPDKTVPIRHGFIPAYQVITMNDIRSGQYDVRYMDLSDGTLSRSEAFELQEVDDGNGTSFSVITMTLFKVSNGNMQTYPLSKDEF